MAFTEIRLQNFRSYTDESFELSDGVNIVVGPNASGKTNLLESVMVLALGRSYRVKDIELIQYDKPWTRLDGLLEHNSRVLKLVRDVDGVSVKKELQIDKQLVKKLTLQKQMPLVLFEPNHLQLLTSSPDLRRTYMDDLITQYTPGYDLLRKNYRRALRQRNTLLKIGAPKDQLFVWNLRLSDMGGQIADQRQKLIAQIDGGIQDAYRRMGGDGSRVTVVYETSCDKDTYSTTLLKKLETNLESDQRRGFTTHGPHRDDLRVILNGHAAEVSASRGETRTLVLALKVIELQLLENHRAAKPLLLLDDVFSELDGARRKALTSTIRGYQTFITTTDADVVIQNFTETCHIIPMEK